MGKVRPKKSSPHTDMTAMTDVAFLLLTFFIMTATFKNNDAAEITTPSSISQIKVPDEKIMIISIDPNGKVFFGVDAMPTRAAMLDNIGETKGLSFTDEERYKFSIQPNLGIPVDSTGVSELADWVFAARKADHELRLALKGDNASKFPVFKDVLANLQSQNINRFNLITSSEEPPAGFRADAAAEE
jgi:biopolymer transport protein ExbD